MAVSIDASQGTLPKRPTRSIRPSIAATFAGPGATLSSRRGFAP
jgi:hypothetical protein